MKKFAVLVGLGLLMAVPAWAGDGYSGNCAWHEKNYSASVVDNEFDKKVLLEVDGTVLEAVSATLTPRYNVKDLDGNVLATDLSTNDLADQYPKLHRALKAGDA